MTAQAGTRVTEATASALEPTSEPSDRREQELGLFSDEAMEWGNGGMRTPCSDPRKTRGGHLVLTLLWSCALIAGYCRVASAA